MLKGRKVIDPGGHLEQLAEEAHHEEGGHRGPGCPHGLGQKPEQRHGQAHQKPHCGQVDEHRPHDARDLARVLGEDGVRQGRAEAGSQEHQDTADQSDHDMPADPCRPRCAGAEQLFGVQEPLFAPKPLDRLDPVESSNDRQHEHGGAEVGVDKGCPSHPGDELLHPLAVAHEAADRVGDRAERQPDDEHGSHPGGRRAASKPNRQAQWAAKVARCPRWP